MTVIFTLLFAGEKLFDIDSGREAKLHATPSQHFTMIFNAFVMMTLCNEVNARKIHGQRNVFGGLHRNPIFIGIWIATMGAQVVIIQWGGRAFATESLTLDQWMWCLFLGVGVLVWGQLVTTVPNTKLPKKFVMGTATEQEIEMMERDVDDPENMDGGVDDMGRRGQILWIRGLTRLQHQIRVVNAFRMGLDADSFDKRSLSSLQSQHSIQNLRLQALKKSASHDAEAAAALFRSTSNSNYQDDTRV